MNWIIQLPSPGHITEALFHYNHAANLLEKGASSVEVSQTLSNAINKIQTEWVLQQDFPPEEKKRELEMFRRMVLEGIDEKSLQSLLQSNELSDIVFFEPQIMDHSVLRRHRYRPDEALELGTAKKASVIHHRLKVAFNEYLSSSDEDTQQRVLKRAAELLYIVRSNIAHGEKTPYGPDSIKMERDDNVCRKTIPLQKILINLLLENPDTKLVVYGTLAPGEPNYSEISDINGKWENCSINGNIHISHGFPAFVWNQTGTIHNVQMFTASELHDRWDRLDSLEGKYYKRILVPAQTPNGLTIANCYQSNTQP